MLSQSASAVLHTLAYTSVFSPRASWKTTQRWLLGPRSYSQKQLLIARKQLHEDPKWKGVLNGWSEPTFFEDKWREVILFAELMRNIPWVQSVWVTGSLAADDPQDVDDIDFFIITDRNRLWLCRIAIVTLGIMRKRYRRHSALSHQVRNQWCCNMWMEAEKQGIFSHQQNLYVARELVQARPVYVRWDVQAEQLLLQNDWVKDWCLTGWEHSVYQAEKTARTPLAGLAALLYHFPLLTWLNDVLFSLQFWFLKAHMTSELVEKEVAFFHPRSLQNPVVKQYEKIVARWKLPPLHSNTRSPQTGRRQNRQP